MKQNRNKPAILVVSFGTSYHDSREAAIGAIERAVEEAFPEFEVRRAFTSKTIINTLKERDGIAVDHMEEALARAAADGITALVVQPTHFMDGLEYTALARTVKGYAGRFGQIELARPLLAGDEDYEAVIRAVTRATKEYDDGRTAVCLMGHGTKARANRVYGTFQEKITKAGFSNYYVGTVEAEPSLTDLLDKVGRAGKYEKVVLRPLMVAAGDHAAHDMAGEEKDSWKCVFEAEGYQVQCILQGLGELKAVRDIYVEHARSAVAALQKSE